MKQRIEIPNDTQRVILASPLNGAPYHGEELPAHYWPWPERTWLRTRRQELRIENGELRMSDSDVSPAKAQRPDTLVDRSDWNGGARRPGGTIGTIGTRAQRVSR